MEYYNKVKMDAGVWFNAPGPVSGQKPFVISFVKDSSSSGTLNLRTNEYRDDPRPTLHGSQPQMNLLLTGSLNFDDYKDCAEYPRSCHDFEKPLFDIYYNYFCKKGPHKIILTSRMKQCFLGIQILTELFPTAQCINDLLALPRSIQNDLVEKTDDYQIYNIIQDFHTYIRQNENKVPYLPFQVGHC